jgi:hypothetical protein
MLAVANNQLRLFVIKPITVSIMQNKYIVLTKGGGWYCFKMILTDARTTETAVVKLTLWVQCELQ